MGRDRSLCQMALCSAGQICHRPKPGVGWPAEADALERYALSDEEFALWRAAVEVHGDKALKVTTLQKYRQL
jgi:Protein of unknown function (DUF1153)